MTISNIKDLRTLLKTCREFGVNTVEIDGIKIELGEPPVKQPRKRTDLPQDAFSGNMKADTQIAIDSGWDKLSDEEKLFYSSGN